MGHVTLEAIACIAAAAVLPVLGHERRVRVVLVLEFSLHLIEQVAGSAGALVQLRDLLRQRPLPTARLHLGHALPHRLGKPAAFVLGSDGAWEPDSG